MCKADGKGKNLGAQETFRLRFKFYVFGDKDCTTKGTKENIDVGGNGIGHREHCRGGKACL